MMRVGPEPVTVEVKHEAAELCAFSLSDLPLSEG